jgi:sulfite reductase (ferredoxin)
MDTHLGWHGQGDGQWFYGLSIENGRIKDDGSFRLRTALRAIIERLQPKLRITPIQDLLLCDLPSAAKQEIEQLLGEHGVLRPQQLTNLQILSMSCPAIPTCGLAISESERALPGIIDQMEEELGRRGLEQEKLSVRMTGCPNGCARPYQSDIGIVGRSGDKYALYLGGRVLGDRLNFLFKDLVPLKDIVPTLFPLFDAFKERRQPGESFGDFCARLGLEGLRELTPQSVNSA